MSTILPFADTVPLSIENIHKTKQLLENHYNKYGGYNVCYILISDYGNEDEILQECFNYLEGSLRTETISFEEAADTYQFLMALKAIPEDDRVAAEPLNTSEHAREWCC